MNRYTVLLAGALSAFSTPNATAQVSIIGRPDLLDSTVPTEEEIAAAFKGTGDLRTNMERIDRYFQALKENSPGDRSDCLQAEVAVRAFFIDAKKSTDPHVFGVGRFLEHEFNGLTPCPRPEDFKRLGMKAYGHH